MSYEHRSNVNVRKIPPPIKIVSITIIILIIIYITVPRFPSLIFTSIARPFWNFEKNAKGVNIPITLELQNTTIKLLQEENIELKEALGRNASSTVIISYILKKPPFSAYDSLVLDVGSDDGVKVGDKVYAIGGVLIGEIIEVSGNKISRVKLYSSYGEKYEVFIGQSNIQTTAFGRGGGSFEITLPRDAKIYENDIITVPNIKSSVFGIVRKIETLPAKAFSTILFSQPVNIYEQKWVEIKK